MILYIFVFISGMAALSWEVLWQAKATLALGASAWGTALTLAVTMGGMGFGALIMGRLLRDKLVKRPLWIYALLEVFIGIGGLFLGAAFQFVESIDTALYADFPKSSSIVYLLGVSASFGFPALCMGATLPVLGLAARQFKTSIAIVYAINTAGAAVGVLLVAFLWVPLLGISHTIIFVSLVNFAVGIGAWLLGIRSWDKVKVAESRAQKSQIREAESAALDPAKAMFVVAITGFVTFMLEVAWFRSMTAAFLGTTDAFAIMLASVLIALYMGAHFVKVLKRSKVSLGVVMCMAGIGILIVTPIVERFDLFMFYSTEAPYILFTRWFFLTLYIIGTPVLLLGVPLPWLLDDQKTAKNWARFYGVNTLASIFGALLAGWLLLPTIGFARTAWLAGIIVVVTGLIVMPRQRRFTLGTIAAGALLAAVVFESGVGRTRVQGAWVYAKDTEVLRSYEGPDATVSVVEYPNSTRMLYIDGFSTTEQSSANADVRPDHYMAWMGHLPMLLHPGPKRALVICFGTGQTANAVRKEHPTELDIVDLNENVYKMADLFPANEGVLSDPIVHKTVMDGRAYIRRTDKTYSVITLEPMPPHFAGTNALYSKEFYELARRKLDDDGIIAQWMPFHIVPPHYSASIAKTFRDVFPNAILWKDESGTGILIGSKNNDLDLSADWPGLDRASVDRNLSDKEIKDSVILNREEMERYASFGETVTDDNKLLAYGKAAYLFRATKTQRPQKNYDLIFKAKREAAAAK